MQIRDNRQGNWLWIDNALIDDFDLTPYQLAVYVGLARFADNREQSSFPSMATLAKRLGMSERKCRAVLRELENQGLIATEERYREDGSQTSNVYVLVSPPKKDPAQEQETALSASPPAPGAAPPSPVVPPPPAPGAAKQDPYNKTNRTSVVVGEKGKTNQGSIIESEKKPSPDDNRGPHPDSLAVLIAAGVTQSVAQELAATCDPAAVVAWCEYVRGARGITSPAGLIVARLKAGELPPEGALAKDDPRQYISGKYADLIQH